MPARPAVRCGTLIVAAVVMISAQAPAPDFSALVTRTDAMIPMRDGARLFTEILVPKHASGPLPILLTRIPYGVIDDEHGIATGMRIYQELLRDGYIFVLQDIRGRYKSEGTFVMNRPPRRDKSSP